MNPASNGGSAIERGVRHFALAPPRIVNVASAARGRYRRPRRYAATTRTSASLMPVTGIAYVV